MIESFRKYTGLMIVVLVLLFIGLVFLDGGSISRALGGKPVMQVGDEAISQKDFSRQTALIRLAEFIPGKHPLPRDTRIIASHYLGDSAVDNNQLTAGVVIMEMARFLQVGFPFGPTSEDRFITNRMNVRKAGLEYGVTPGDEELESFVENVLFADPEGNFDQEAYNDFLKNGVSQIGGNRGFTEYIRDLLTARNLAKVIGGGLSPEMETLRLAHDIENQVITGKQITLDAAPLEGKVKPTPEELEAYFEENRDNYKSDELRKVSYVLIEPDWEATLAKVTEEKEKAAQKKAAQEAEEKKKAEEARKKAEEAAAKANQEKDTAEANQPTPEGEGSKPAPTEDPAPAENPAPAPAGEPAPAEEPTPTDAPAPAEEPTPVPAGDGSEGDPGEQGEPATTPAADPAPATDDPKPADTTPSLVDPAPATGGSTGLEDLLKDNKKDLVPNLPSVPSVPDAPKTPKEQLNSFEKRQAVEAMIPKVEEFYDAVVSESLGRDFEKIAKEMELTVLTTEFFAKTKAPAPLNASAQNSPRGGTVADAIFELPTTGDPDELLSAPFQTEHGWIIARFEEVTDAVPLPYEDVRVKVSIDLKKKMAREMLVEQAKETREKLIASLAAGKSFDDAAKELELEPTELKDLTGGQTINFGGRVQRIPSPPAFDAAKLTNPGEIAPVEFTPSEDEATRALIIFVEKREVMKDAAYLGDLEEQFKQQSQLTSLIAFENWLTDRYNESNVIPPKSESR